MNSHATDYLVIGSGAVGLAFADTLLAETADAQVTIVDRQGVPGGHWADAYGFVTLHQPSSFYGVNTVPLGSGSKDTHGPNAGLYELATGAEVLAYFDTVLRRRLLASGRVRYLPMTDHLGEGGVRSLLTGAEGRIEVRRRLVDATFQRPSVPARRQPRYAIEGGATVVTPNALPSLGLAGSAPPPHFTIVGAGKTAMDVGVWLLGRGVPAVRITWVRPRDAWLLNRRSVQPGMEFFHEAIGAQAALMVASAQATSADDLFVRLEAAGMMLRIDRSVVPRMYHYAIVSEGEIEQLRSITDVVRMGHVQAIGADGLRLADGTRAMPRGTLYIDCTASAVERCQTVPVFQPGLVVPQMVRAPQPAFSAAFVAHVEATYTDDEQKNAICKPVPFPDTPQAYPRTLLANLRNEGVWAKDPALRAWILASRLDGFRRTVEAVPPDDADKRAVLAAIREHAPAAVANLQKLAA